MKNKNRNLRHRKENEELAASVDNLANANAVAAIEHLRRDIEIMDAGWRRSLLHKASIALVCGFLINCACLVVFYFSIQNFVNWKSEVESLSATQVEHIGELVRVIRDTSWINLQRLMIDDTLKRSMDQLKNLRELKIWYDKNKKNLEAKRYGKGSKRSIPKSNTK